MKPPSTRPCEAAAAIEDQDAVHSRFKEAPIAFLTGYQGTAASGFGDGTQDCWPEFVQLVLEHIVHRSLPHGTQGRGFGNRARDEQEGHRWGQLAGDLQSPRSGDLRQGPIRQDGVGKLLVERGAQVRFGGDDPDCRLQAPIPQGIGDQLQIFS
jgi:hypothetical protein